MFLGATVGRDDDVTSAASVVGERSRPRPAALRVDCREQKQRHVLELAADDAAVRTKLADHASVEARRVGPPVAHLTRAGR
jgi:hypothetical protein